MKTLELKPIGHVIANEEGIFLTIDSGYRTGLQAMDGFSHLTVIWYFSDFDTPADRSVLQVAQPYINAPDIMGVFATRSPLRPNPIGLTTVQVIQIDEQKGLIQIPYIDARHNTPILDLKPYTPSFDRVEHPNVPDWCRNWPANIETSGDFNWADVFTFD